MFLSSGMSHLALMPGTAPAFEAEKEVHTSKTQWKLKKKIEELIYK